MTAMLAEHLSFDKELVTLQGRDGAVLVTPTLQGRIYCQLGNELIHRLDVERMERPSLDQFNNLGGNSLWPAPEGGPFAFNYLPDSGAWLVQDGIGKDPACVTARDERRVTLSKTIRLRNRRGKNLRVRYARAIERDDIHDSTTAGLEAVAYTSCDSLEPLDTCSRDDVLLAPWSLEQFPGGDGVTVFASMEQPTDCINFDFYGMPETAPVYGANGFRLAMGGKSKFQIGVKVSARPRVLGALDRRRSLLILRETEPRDGLYFNIADNDQPRGPWSAADLYSVFNGGELGFFELETIGAMQLKGNAVCGGSLVTKTAILRGPLARLTQWLHKRHGICLDPEFSR